jgi:SAM-dependent methyltransferase
MRTAFDAYGELGTMDRTLTEKSGRYNFQADAEDLIVAEIIQKLSLDSGHSLLEIGCGAGNLLIPLSAYAGKCIGMDHENLIEIARKRPSKNPVGFIVGKFPDVPIREKFDRILVYSVLHYSPNFYAALDFIIAATTLLKPNGVMLLGDLPNSDTKHQYLSTNEGKDQQKDWLAKCEIENRDSPLAGIDVLGSFNDEMIIAIWNALNNRGFKAGLKKQNPALPFGNTREDLIVTANAE